jgi:hypothetical protein
MQGYEVLATASTDDEFLAILDSKCRQKTDGQTGGD